LRAQCLTLALGEFGKASALGDKSATLLDDHASLLDGLEEYKLAIAKYTEALKLKPDDPKILMKRGSARVNDGQPAEGEEAFRAVLRRAPSHAEAHTGVGYVRALRKDVAGGLREAHLATLYGAGDYGVLHNVACIYAGLALGDKARQTEYEDLAID